MTDRITFYAMTDVHTSHDAPRTVLRTTETETGRVDELFSRNLRWELSPLLYSAEHGDTMFDFNEISKEEADRIVERIRAQAGGDE
jgi:hypothetical protein